MKSNGDSIQFEAREELQDLIIMVGNYVRQNGKEKNNETVKDFYSIITDMNMYW